MEDYDLGFHYCVKDTNETENLIHMGRSGFEYRLNKESPVPISIIDNPIQ